ncbi:hypothetical protein RND81_09G057600 [Saponaria officinalis]|uniref:Wax synthase domain-containing protein n=1 Tax=Saponaria officinalis TaxID=3572 RepID=A0AAW1IH05_SAPOF
MEDNNEAINFTKAWLKVIASLSYCYFISSKFPKGIYRFFSLLPIFYLFTLLPLHVTRPIPSIVLGGFFTWLANFKLLLYSFDLGPSSTSYPQGSFLKFFFITAFPIEIKEKRPDVRSLTSKTGHKKVIPLNYWSKVTLFVLLEIVYNTTKSMVVLCGLMYLFIDILFGICDLIVKSIFDVELYPPSDEPYLSTSLQDFWGKRWNHMISSALRHTIYKPTKSTFEKFVGHKCAPLFGVVSCFIVSGLMHELIYYHMTRVSPTWEVTWFFVLHGCCVVLEMLVKRALGPKWRLHWAFSAPLTVGFVMVTGFWLFFPQIMRNDVDKRATEDIMGLVKYIEGAIYKIVY